MRRKESSGSQKGFNDSSSELNIPDFFDSSPFPGEKKEDSTKLFLDIDYSKSKKIGGVSPRKIPAYKISELGESYFEFLDDLTD